ncbi:MAG: cyclic pyranopterin monophosphate synthase MoaC [Aestuariibacter sp.]
MGFKLTHTDASGAANMVDIGDKTATARSAKARCFVHMRHATLELIRDNGLKKGDVLAVARVAGIQAAKRCADLIPLCHPLMLSKVIIDFELDDELSGIHIFSECKLTGTTGVEMEALTGASIAACTLFDMCKAVDKAMTISDLKVISKSGGKSGDWRAEEHD